MIPAEWDAFVVGSGPNGLAAAITLARAGRRVAVLEAAPEPGGGLRSAPITLPGFLHDLGSAIHPLAVASPFFRSLPRNGLEWAIPPAALAHPFDDGTAVLLHGSPAQTAQALGRDGPAYRRLMEPLVASWGRLDDILLGPIGIPRRHPFLLAQFGLCALPPAAALARLLFRGERARALFAGLAAHAVLPLEAPASASFALVLGVLGHLIGWPLPRGGAQRVAGALVRHLEALGGRVVTGQRVDDLDALGPVRPILLDLTPRQVVAIAGHRLPASYRDRLVRFRYGPGVFKVDWALDAPVPWAAAACWQAATVHLGATLDEIAASERAAWDGPPADWPFVLVVQPTLFDPSRAPAGQHTVWAYCHVPNGCTLDMTSRIEAQIERFAPGFRNRVLARHVLGPAALERLNANLVGGDIGGGANDIRQLFARPMARVPPYATPVRGLYLCSSSTPPGGGVHGMCGFHAAQAALAGFGRDK